MFLRLYSAIRLTTHSTPPIPSSPDSPCFIRPVMQETSTRFIMF